VFSKIRQPAARASLSSTQCVQALERKWKSARAQTRINTLAKKICS
jgi:hypothetical protein